METPAWGTLHNYDIEAYTTSRYNSASELCYRLDFLKLPKSPLSYRSCFPETTEVTSTVQPNQNRFDFFIVSSGNYRFPYRLV